MSDSKRFTLDSLETESKPLIRLYPKLLQQFLGRLILPGEISLIHGSERSHLTLLAHWIAINATIRTHPVAFLDSGNNFSPMTIRSMVSDAKRERIVLKLIGVGTPLSLDDFEYLVKRASSKERLHLIVVDSLTGLLNLSGSPGSAERQRRLFKSMDSIRQTLSATHTHLLLTDYSSAWCSQSSPLGGLVLAHAVDSIVRLIRLPDTREIIRLLVERSSILSNFGGIVLRINHRGVSTARRGGV